MSNKKSGVCEWNPKGDKPATDAEGCLNLVTVSVGHNGQWHLCSTCAALPRFKRFRVRTIIRKEP